MWLRSFLFCDISIFYLFFLPVEFMLRCGIFLWQEFEWMLITPHPYTTHTHTHTHTLTRKLPSIHLLALWRQECHHSWRTLLYIFCKFWMKPAHIHTHTHTHTNLSTTFMLALSWLSPWVWAAVTLQLPNQNKQTLSILSLLWSDRPEAWILNHSKNAAPGLLGHLQLFRDPCHYIDNT